MSESAVSPGPAQFSAEVTDQRNPDLKQSVHGSAKTVAAWLRAAANEIDPPPPTRPVMRAAAMGAA